MLLDSDGVDGAGDDHEERDKDLEGVDCLPAPSCDILTLLAPPTIFRLFMVRGAVGKISTKLGILSQPA